jgi:Lar family restriction alleviation protein
MADLKPCPFCGSDRVDYIPIEEQNYDDHVEGFILCRGCGFSSDVFFDFEIAEEKWNRRDGGKENVD